MCTGPHSSPGRFAPADGGHHPATADRLSFRKQGPGQHAGGNTFRHADVPCVFNVRNMLSRCLDPDPRIKWHQLLQAAAAIEQQTGQVAAAQVQQLPQVSGAAAPQAPQQQPQAQPQPQAQQPPLMLQVDGTGDTSSDDEEDEEEEYDEEDEEEREVAEDGQVEEVRTERNLSSKWVTFGDLILYLHVCRAGAAQQ